MNLGPAGGRGYATKIPPPPPRIKEKQLIFADIYPTSSYALSGIICAPAKSTINKYQTYYRRCEYCGTINKVSYEINNCESCGAQFGLLDFLDNIRLAEQINPFIKYNDTSSYKRLALIIIENAFKKHIKFHNNVDEIINCLTVLPDEKINKLMDYLIGFITPDTIVKNMA